jgi:hypothetical protein
MPAVGVIGPDGIRGSARPAAPARTLLSLTIWPGATIVSASPTLRRLAWDTIIEVDGQTVTVPGHAGISSSTSAERSPFACEERFPARRTCGSSCLDAAARPGLAIPRARLLRFARGDTEWTALPVP